MKTINKISVKVAIAILLSYWGSLNHHIYSQVLIRNYVMTSTYTQSGSASPQERIDYYDGLGRPEETVDIRNSPSHKDVVTLREYDFAGRDSHIWLPVVIPNNSGQYITPANVKTAASTYYEDDKCYNLSLYELSTLDRPTETYGPGTDWHVGSRGIKTTYMVNISGNDTLNCLRFTVDETVGDTLITLKKSSQPYSTGELFVTRTTDEDSNVSFEFKDMLGRVILIRQIDTSADTDTFNDTYFIYNNLGNLIAVLPPQASYIFGKSSLSSWRSNQDATLKQYAYLYKYNSRNLPVAKKLPGCAWIFYIYDKGGRLVFSQDGNQRRGGKWIYTISDLLGRQCFSGLCSNDLNPFSTPVLPQLVTASRSAGSSGSEPYKGYSLSGVTLNTPSVLSVTYYDDYSFLGKNGLPAATDTRVSYDSVAEADGFGKHYSTSSQNLVTGTLTAKLDGLQTPSYLYSVFYYDNRSRLIQSNTSNQLGGTEKEYMAYNFVGQLIKRKHIHSATNKPSQTELYTFTYDHAGRLLTTSHQLNEDSTVCLVNNEYDELGRLKCNKRNGQPSLQIDYAYNIRSWTKSISSPLFTQTLYYNDSRSGSTNIPCYNGNISGMDWSVANDKSRGYDFSYDALSRLTGADYLEDNTRSDKFSTSYSYDKHGNILSLIRSGNRGTTTHGEIDNLTLSYQGNQLIKVEDTAPAPTLSMSMDFKDNTDQEIEYSYDANGNQTKDLNKGITGIEYNFLNLPRRINFSGTNIPKNEYVYSAAGTKLSVIHNSTTEKRTDYVGNMIYENGSLKRILVDGGYIENGVYHFYIQDHLGNNRVVAKADGTVVQSNHYYPYGMSFAEGTFAEKQPYKYNGKELDNANGLDWYDYGARHYEANLGRWHVVDPMAEGDYGLSPYNYCFNNPFKLIDPNGMWPGNPLLQPFGRYQYGSNAAVNSFKFIHNTVAAIVNTPINIINQLADETGYIYNNGVGSYLSSGTKNIGDAISSELTYRVNTPISQQAADTWQSMKDPQNWENATAMAVLMLSPMKGSGTVGSTQAVSKVVKGGTKTVYRVFGGDSRAQGFSWTPINPQKVTNYRSKAGLPSGGESGFNNTADFMIKGEVKTKNIIKKRAALPLDGNKGGLPEYIINPEHVNITNFTVLKP